VTIVNHTVCRFIRYILSSAVFSLRRFAGDFFDTHDAKSPADEDLRRCTWKIRRQLFATDLNYFASVETIDDYLIVYDTFVFERFIIVSR